MPTLLLVLAIGIGAAASADVVLSSLTRELAGICTWM